MGVTCPPLTHTHTVDLHLLPESVGLGDTEALSSQQPQPLQGISKAEDSETNPAQHGSFRRPHHSCRRSGGSRAKSRPRPSLPLTLTKKTTESGTSQVFTKPRVEPNLRGELGKEPRLGGRSEVKVAHLTKEKVLESDHLHGPALLCRAPASRGSR